MADDYDSELALVFSLYEGLARKAPGSDASTLKAFSMLEGLPSRPRIVDFGCGAGIASLAIARAAQCMVTAVDVHQPFLDELNTQASHEGLTDQIRTVQADMADPLFSDGSFDLIWSEGAIYNIGFEQGLRKWRRLLRPGGFVAATELTWLSVTPPQHVVDFWATEYPAMTTVKDNLAKVRSAGFEPVTHFVLPSEDWENYYGPLQKQLAAFRSRYADHDEAQTLSDNVQREIDMWNECGGSYGYVFYVGKAA